MGSCRNSVGTWLSGRNVTITTKPTNWPGCRSRDSNPGLLRGRRESYHYTTDHLADRSWLGDLPQRRLELWFCCEGCVKFTIAPPNQDKKDWLICRWQVSNFDLPLQLQGLTYSLISNWSIVILYTWTLALVTSFISTLLSCSLWLWPHSGCSKVPKLRVASCHFMFIPVTNISILRLKTPFIL